MSDMTPGVETRAAVLRRTFDAAFALPVGQTLPQTSDFISIRLGGDVHAIGVAEIAGLHKEIAITPLPSPMPELLGLAGFRGALMPVYDLAALLGYPASTGRWMVVEAGRAAALAFDEFEGHFRVESSTIIAHAASGSPHIRRLANASGEARPIIDIPALLAALRARAQSFQKEH